MISIPLAFALALATPIFVLGYDNTRNDNVRLFQQEYLVAVLGSRAK
jgi:uncharacterized linocin/CFP29 family protein